VRELRELRDAKKRGKKSLTGVGMAGMVQRELRFPQIRLELRKDYEVSVISESDYRTRTLFKGREGGKGGPRYSILHNTASMQSSNHLRNT